MLINLIIYIYINICYKYISLVLIIEYLIIRFVIEPSKIKN
jgi:hypothetical protein